MGVWPFSGRESALKLYGNVEIREVQLGFRIGGRIDKLLVDEGDRVAAGQVLAVLDTRPLQDRMLDADARLAAADAGVARDAHGSRPQQIAAAQADLATANAMMNESRRQFERRAALYGKGFLSRAELQTAEANVAAAMARQAAARAGLSLAQEGVRAEDRAVSLANRASAAAAAKSVQTDLHDAQIIASEAGQVLTRVREAGAIVQGGGVVLTVALTQPVRVRAYIAEPDLPRLRPGMKVAVRVDGSDKSWAAQVGYISPVAEFTPKSVQTEQLRADLVYRLRLTVDDPKGELRQGQPVTVVLPDGSGG
ncbi:MAG: hypothetical protein RLY97_1031 [Pseudomonadota bacterium]